MDTKQETSQFPGKGVHWITDPLEERPIKVAKEGPGSFPPETVIARFSATKSKFAAKQAVSVKRNGQWIHWTWEEYYNDAMRTAKALIHLGAVPGRGVAIIGFNSPEWFLADLGAIACGAIAAPIYTTNNPEAVRYIADHCKAPIALAENEFQLKKFLAVKNQLPELKALVQWSGKIPEGDHGIPIYTWEEFLKLSEKVGDDELQKRIDGLKPARCATLIYTSGTTGPPKGVMVSHDNVTWTAKLAATTLGMTEDEVIISYLPLSHIAAQMVDLHAPISVGAHVYFAQPDALKGSLLETLKEVRPTLFLGVPRVWEKIQEKMQAIGRTVTGFKKTIADTAKKIGLEANYAIQNNESTPWGYWLADKIVFSKIKEALGLDRARLCGTAAAPISKDTLEYFLSINIPIFEIYGMSECTGPQTVNHPKKWKTGSCGPSLPGTELKLDNPDKDGNGEICYRGRHIFQGYMYNDKETAGTIDGEGWLHSGDVGVEKNGFLYITGRIKELIITAGGENIPPVLIEEEIRKEVGQVVSNIMLIGDRRKFLSVVFTLRLKQKANAVQGEYPFSDEIAPEALDVLKKIGSSVTTATEAIDDAKLKEYLSEGIKKANKRAASNAQNVQKFFIIPTDFTIETGELTPSLKLKRKVVAENLKAQIEKLYEETETSTA